MYRTCTLCGGIHPAGYKCMAQPKTYNGGKERKLRNSYRWHKKSEAIREEAQYLCEVCRDEGIFTYDNLEVHHIEKLKDNNDLLLEDDNLICLCARHHKEADAGKIKKEYLKKLAKERKGISPGG